MKIKAFLIILITIISGFDMQAGIISDSDSTGVYEEKGLKYVTGWRNMGEFTYIYCNLYRNDSLIKKSIRFAPYPVFRFFNADVNNDGSTDICLGVIKKTWKDTTEGRRPFFYMIKNNMIAPLYLSSATPFELMDFYYIKRNGLVMIKTLEKVPVKDVYIVGIYYWKGFGFSLKEIAFKNRKYKRVLNKFRDLK